PVFGEKVPVIRPRKAELVEPFETIAVIDQARELEEHWRLLYVGMTRASERLVVAGIEPSRGVPENSWHKRVERALASLGAETAENARWGAVIRYASGPTKTAKSRLASGPFGNAAVPEWARTPAPREARPPRPLAPSAIAIDDSAAPPSEAMRAAAQ